jgi:hypothetical protein
MLAILFIATQELEADAASIQPAERLFKLRRAPIL